MKRLGILLVVLLLAGCAYKQQPIYNVAAPVPLSAQSLPPPRIEALIIAGAQQRGWRLDRLAPGQLRAMQVADSFLPRSISAATNGSSKSPTAAAAA